MVDVTSPLRVRREKALVHQTASLIEFAKNHELEVPKEWVFEDEGYSGATLERPGLERVRDLAAEGHSQTFHRDVNPDHSACPG